MFSRFFSESAHCFKSCQRNSSKEYRRFSQFSLFCWRLTSSWWQMVQERATSCSDGNTSSKRQDKYWICHWSVQTEGLWSLHVLILQWKELDSGSKYKPKYVRVIYLLSYRYQWTHFPNKPYYRQNHFSWENDRMYFFSRFRHLGPVEQRVDNVIYRILITIRWISVNLAK